MKLLKLLIGQVLTGFSIALVVASAFGSFAITTCNIGMANIDFRKKQASKDAKRGLFNS